MRKNNLVSVKNVRSVRFLKMKNNSKKNLIKGLNFATFNLMSAHTQQSTNFSYSIQNSFENKNKFYFLHLYNAKSKRSKIGNV